MNELIQILKKRPELRQKIGDAMSEDQVEAFYDKNLSDEELAIYQKFWYAMMGWEMRDGEIVEVDPIIVRNNDANL